MKVLPFLTLLLLCLSLFGGVAVLAEEDSQEDTNDGVLFHKDKDTTKLTESEKKEIADEPDITQDLLQEVLGNVEDQLLGKDTKDKISETRAKIIKQEESGTLWMGTGDVDIAHSCVKAYNNHCKDVTPGLGNVHACLRKIEILQKNNALDTKVPIEEVCLIHMEEFREHQARNINNDVKMAAVCQDDVEKLCKTSQGDFGLDGWTGEGATYACLRKYKSDLTSGCQKEVEKMMEIASQQWTADAGLARFCKTDHDTFCSKEVNDDGAVQNCFFEHREQLEFECKDELLRQMSENAGDFSFKPELRRKCTPERVKFCSHITTGGNRVITCLEDNANEVDFSINCYRALQDDLAQNMLDFRLDADIKESCEEDIEANCKFEKNSLESSGGFNGRVLQCLYMVDSFSNSKCQDAVDKHTERVSNNVEFDLTLSVACKDDIDAVCKDEKAGDSRIIHCIQHEREKVSNKCRAALLDHEARMAKSVFFQSGIQNKCQQEIKDYCSTKGEHGSVLHCLKHSESIEYMSKGCEDEVKAFEHRQGQDYRLRPRLAESCATDITKHCKAACKGNKAQEGCGGEVYECLQRTDEALSSGCRKEVFRLEMEEAKDPTSVEFFDKACKTDVNTYCKGFEESDYMMCLTLEFRDISEPCQMQVELLNHKFSQDIKMKPKLFEACSADLQVYCDDVKDGKGQKESCLYKNQRDLSSTCMLAMTQEKVTLGSGGFERNFGMYEACKGEVAKLCVDHVPTENVIISNEISCLADKIVQVRDHACEKHVIDYTTYMWEHYAVGHPITKVCDEFTETCLVKSMDRSREGPKYYMEKIPLVACLLDEDIMDQKCKDRLDILDMTSRKDQREAEGQADMIADHLEKKFKMNQFNKNADSKHLDGFLSFDSDMTDDQYKDSMRHEVVNVAEISRNRALSKTGIILQGNVAYAAMTALVLVTCAASYFGYKKFIVGESAGGAYNHPYTIVTKSGDV